MPATVAHAYFAKDVYEILPSDISNELDLKRCKMFAQGVDSLKFYNLISIMPGKDVRRFDGYFHRNKSQDFFINLLRYVRDNNIDDRDVNSFIVGFICHYVLDSTIHPYVYYKTGVFDKRYPRTYKYNNVHAFMETFLDNDMIKRRESINPYDFKIADFCFNIYPFSKSLNKTIDYTFYNTFKFRDMSTVYYKSLKQMKTAIRLFRQDKYGIKKTIYKAIDTLTPRSCFRFEAVSYHYPLTDKHNFLNQTHKIWRNPAVYDMTSTESFVDLYLKSIKQAKVLICASFDYLDNKDIDLEKIFDNTSFVTGLNCKDKKELKYFEF